MRHLTVVTANCSHAIIASALASSCQQQTLRLLFQHQSATSSTIFSIVSSHFLEVLDPDCHIYPCFNPPRSYQNLLFDTRLRLVLFQNCYSCLTRHAIPRIGSSSAQHLPQATAAFCIANLWPCLSHFALCSPSLKGKGNAWA